MTETAAGGGPYAVELAFLTDTGTERPSNEDACGSVQEDQACALVVVADGVSSSEAGEVASQLAVEVVLRAFGEEPRSLGAGGRLYRAVQQANIAIYDKALAVPELRGMATTLTAVAVERGELTIVHVGDSRAYLLRRAALTQLTKDHTVAAERSRYGLMSRERARTHADRCVLTRSVGRELIVSRDRSTQRLEQGDALLVCSDGLYNVLDDRELAHTIGALGAQAACEALVSAANARGTPDNLTAAMLRMVGPTPDVVQPAGLGHRLRGMLGWR